MWRAILGVIVGFVVMVLWVMICSAVALLVLGHSFAYKEGALEVTLAWCLVDLGIGLVGAVLGGLVTVLVAPSSRRTPVKVLAGIIFVLGLASAVGHLILDDPTAEPSKPVEEMTAFEVASETSAPTWHNFALPFVGGIGVLLGGCLRRRPATVGEDGLESGAPS
ncbi:MAG: hypothetical protein ACYSU7_10140 [Planctomycetota bacterium]